MAVNGINHVNIRTSDVATSARFYTEVLGFEFRNEPLIMGRQPNWLFDKTGRPIIHLRLMTPESNSTGPIDHVALDCEGLATVIDRLRERNAEFTVSDIQSGLTLVFVRDPHGVMLELNFRGETAAQSVQSR